MENKKEIRIFLTPSHICTVYLTLLARETRKENQIDILLLDASRRKKGLSNIILETSKSHDWSLVHDFSIFENEDFDYTPTTRKSFTRRIKSWPIIKNIYNYLLERHLQKADHKYKNELSAILNGFSLENSKVSLFMLTQTYLNRPLEQLFPNATLNYVEHGIGDYYHILNPKIRKGNFYCVFAESYKRYLVKIGNSTQSVNPIPNASSFPRIANDLLRNYNKSIHLEEIVLPEKPFVFVLLEAVDMYQVKHSFWTDYLDHIFSKLENPGKFHYLLKPHPMQSEISLIATKNHFEKLGFSYSLLNHPSLINASAEIIFSHWEKKTEHVFCLFSSGCFYLSQLYSEEKITFWYSTAFMSKYLENAPPQFYKSFTESRQLIEEVFTENCKPY